MAETLNVSIGVLKDGDVFLDLKHGGIVLTMTPEQALTMAAVLVEAARSSPACPVSQ